MKNAISMMKVVSLLVVGLLCSPMANAQTSWLDHYFTPGNGWQVSKHVRTTGDVNGDGKEDLIGFGGSAVFVSFSTGSGFGPQQEALKNMTPAQGWDMNKHPRAVGDVNGDGKDDLIGYGEKGVFVALSNGKGFNPATMVLSDYYTAANGWNPARHVRTVGDVNGDGKTDLVGFGEKGVFVALSNGAAFKEPRMVLENMAIGAGAWEVSKHTRMVADVNGDGKEDLVGFGGPGVFVAFSTGSGFEPQQLLLNHYFTQANGWANTQHVRTAGDINGDGKADLIGFGNAGVYVAMSMGKSFREPVLLVENYGYNQGQWRVQSHVRVMGDVNGDNRDDIVGYGQNAVLVSTNLRELKQKSGGKKLLRNQ
ncbi:MAG: VCBS repeat-containing protein [Bacteroidota bacterium]